MTMYATWTTIATLVNLTIVLTYDAKMLPEDAAITTLSIFLTRLHVVVTEVNIAPLRIAWRLRLTIRLKTIVEGPPTDVTVHVIIIVLILRLVLHVASAES